MRIYYCLVQYVNPMVNSAMRIVDYQEMDEKDITNNTEISKRTYARYMETLQTRSGYNTLILVKNVDDNVFLPPK